MTRSDMQRDAHVMTTCVVTVAPARGVIQIAVSVWRPAASVLSASGGEHLSSSHG
jgi:hypothetical protein